MSVAKKLLLLFLFFILLNIASIYNFNYQSSFKENNELKSTFDKEGFLSNIINKFSNKQPQTTINKKPFQLKLVKKNGVIELNGLFKDDQEVTKVTDILGINRNGEIKIDKEVTTNLELLKKVAIIIPTIKDFFLENSELTIIENNITLKGEVKDTNYKNILDSLAQKMNLKIETNIAVIKPEPINEQPIMAEQTPTKVAETPKVQTIKPVIIDKKAIQQKINETIAKNKITFERRSSNVTNSSYETIVQVSKILTEYPSIKIEVAGHTDSRGEAALNKQISQDRALSVREILIKLGINENRITAVGYGEEFPIAKDDKDGLSEINRRVEFNILGE